MNIDYLNHCMDPFSQKVNLKCIGKADFCIQNFWLYSTLQLLFYIQLYYHKVRMHLHTYLVLLPVATIVYWPFKYF